MNYVNIKALKYKKIKHTKTEYFWTTQQAAFSKCKICLALKIPTGKELKTPIHFHLEIAAP